jgi:hypothetical protein
LVVGFFREYGGEFGVFRGKDRFGLGFFSCQGEFHGGGEFGNHRRSHGDKAGSAADDSVDDPVFDGSGEELILFLPVVELIEFLVSDGVDMDMARGSECGAFEVGVVAGGIYGVGEEEFFGLVEGFGNR